MNCAAADLLIFGYILDVVKLMFVTLNFRVRNNGVTRVPRSVLLSPIWNREHSGQRKRIAADTGKNKKATKSRPRNDDVTF
jgi:hypothetical protein